MLGLARWIESPEDLGTVSPEFRRTVKFDKKIKNAVARVSAYGVYELRINGEKPTEAILMPGWMNPDHHIQYQTYDITKMLSTDTTVSVLVGFGWALGRFGSPAWPNYFETRHCFPAIIASIKVEYEDGTGEEIVSDGEWEVYTSFIQSSEMYDGEVQDMTAPIRYVGNAAITKKQDHPLIPQIGVDIIEHERISPISLIITPKGERVIDFGQNLAGYAEFKIKGNRGERIRVSHAEVLDKDGNFYTENMRDARNTNIYVLDGEERIFKPRFSFQGFRYIRLDEYPGKIDLSAVTAVAIYSDIRRTGYFASGDARINQLYSNVIWGQRSNFIDVPTDCPQRDERYGWTGDAQVFCRTAAINYDVERFFKKWLTSMRSEQGKDGAIDGTTPKTRHNYTSKVSAAWADAAVICPYEMYRAYGNLENLGECFDMMRRWVDYMHAFGDEEFLFIGGNHFGDWLGMDAGEGEYIGATQTDLIASAYFAYSTSLLIKSGEALGEDMTDYKALYKNVRSAFRSAFMHNGMPKIYPKADGLTKRRTVSAVTQTALSLILYFELYEECERAALVEKLVGLIRENGNKITTGFVGTPYILHALSRNGRADVAYDLLLQDRNPSWLYTVDHGATTMWEHWDSIREDGELWSADMNSFNHYAYGAVYDWMFGAMLGVEVDVDGGGAGYKRIIYAPVCDARIGSAKGSIDSRAGKIESAWEYLPDGRVRYELTLPKDTVATVRIDGLDEVTVCGGQHVFIK